MCICDSVQSVAYRVSEIPRLCRVIRRRIVLLRSGWEIGVSVSSAEVETFQSYGTSGTLLPTLSGWADEGVRPYVDCADFQADKSVRLNVGGRGRPSSTAPAAPFSVRMLVSRFIAIAFRDCARGLAQVHSLAQKQRSFRMTTLKVLHWPG